MAIAHPITSISPASSSGLTSNGRDTHCTTVCTNTTQSDAKAEPIVAPSTGRGIRSKTTSTMTTRPALIAMPPATATTMPSTRTASSAADLLCTGVGIRPPSCQCTLVVSRRSLGRGSVVEWVP